MQRTSRDPERVREALEGWLALRLPDGAAPRVSGLRSTSDTGMSSETVLFEASWRGGDADRTEHLVARIAPRGHDVSVFPSYDLRRQYEVVRLVGELTSVPVPRLWWYEADDGVLGSPFFVMSEVDGVVPPDVMPYTFGDNWLFDASAEDQGRLQDATVDVLARLHAVDEPEERFAFLGLDAAGATLLHRHVAHTRAWYEFAAADGGRSPLLERAFAWLESHWPDHVGPTVLAWGDARVGNVLYRGFSPVAVLDWEMAALGPPELDVAWLVTAHRTFQHLAAAFDLPGMPGFLREADVCAAYESLTGYGPRDLGFYCTYAALQWGIVFLRTGRRQVHFGERAAPEHPDDLLHNRGLLEALLAGRGEEA